MHNFTRLCSPYIFNNIEFDKHSLILLISLLSNFSQYSCDVLVGFGPGSRTIYFSRSIRRSSILGFHSSKFWLSNLLISILKLSNVIFHCTNQHYKYPTEPRFITKPRSINCVEPSALKASP